MNTALTDSGSAAVLADLPPGTLSPGRAGHLVVDLVARGVGAELAASIAHNLQHQRCRFARWSAVYCNSSLSTNETIEFLRSRQLW